MLKFIKYFNFVEKKPGKCNNYKEFCFLRQRKFFTTAR